MLIRDEKNTGRALKTQFVDADLVVVGGGLAGCCAAITAAREGIRVALVQDRPVLGGNASSEIRLWALGATAHMGNNNRWAREGGVIDEILVENLYRNPEGNAIILDTILLEKVVAEPNLTLLLNTAVHDLALDQQQQIQSVRAFCSQNSTQYDLRAPLFCDASGDGIVGFLAGAAFRIGAESLTEFGELLAANEEHRDLLGDSLYFYSRDTGRPVRFTAPSYALDDITKIPRYRSFNTREHGCQLWWIEYGGSRDTVHETEEIKWELWKIVYGVWDHIKNSGEFPEAENLTLEWVGAIPGKRESRRFEGDYMLVQQDIVEQRTHYDAVSVGGWAIDLHPVDAIYSDQPPCTQWHAKGVYQIPYRTMYSRNVPNLFLAGRILSASHIAFGSTRVMVTCAHNGQAVGAAAALCRQQGWMPRDLAAPERIGTLQGRLQRLGQFIPGVHVREPEELAQRATVTASSRYELGTLQPSGEWITLDGGRAMLLPVSAGPMPRVTFGVRAEADVELVAELRWSSRRGNFTPDVVLERRRIPLTAGVGTGGSKTVVGLAANGDAPSGQRPLAARGGSATVAAPPTASASGDSASDARQVTVDFDATINEEGYAFVCLMAGPGVEVQTSDQRVTGVLSLRHRPDHRVASDSEQAPPDGVGIDRFEFWTPERRPQGKNLAVSVDPPLDCFGPANVTGGVARPTAQPNVWAASLEDPQPTLQLRWDQPQQIRRVEISFDTDFDHAMESVLMGHPERVMPFCVRNYRVLDGSGRLLFEKRDNHQTRNVIELEEPAETDALIIEVEAPSAQIPAAIFEVRCY